jgi:exosortase/archaeosortase family protein
VGLAVFQVGFETWFARTPAFDAVLAASARATAASLDRLGVPAASAGARVVTTDTTMTISRGCDGVQALAVFVCAVAAFRATVGSKLIALASGVLLLTLLNLVRLVTLFVALRHAPALFDVLHITVWPFAVIAACAGLWLVWVRWTVAVSR